MTDSPAWQQYCMHPTSQPAQDADSPILYRSPAAASSNRLSRLLHPPSPPTQHAQSSQVARPERPPRRRPVSVKEAIEGEEFWRGEVRRRKSVGLGLAFGMEGFEIEEGDEPEEEDERAAQLGGIELQDSEQNQQDAFGREKSQASSANASQADQIPHSDAPSPLPPTLSPPTSPRQRVDPHSPPRSTSVANRMSTHTSGTTSSTSASPSRAQNGALSRYSTLSGESTAATSLSGGEEEDDLPLTPGLAPPPLQFALAVEGGKAMKGALLRPDTLHEAFDFPVPPGMSLPPPSPASIISPTTPAALSLDDEETSQLDAAAASFSFSSSSITSFAPFSRDLEQLSGLSSSTRVSALPPGARSTSRPHALDPWAVDSAALDDEDRAVLGALLPVTVVLAAGQPAEEDEADLRRSAARSPNLVPIPIPVIHRQQPSADLNNLLSLPVSASAASMSPRTPPNRSPSLPALTPDAPSSSTTAREQSRSPFGFMHKSLSSATVGHGKFPRVASPPPLSPTSSSLSPSLSTGAGKRSSMLMSFASGLGGLGRSRSRTHGEKDSKLSVIGEGGSTSASSPSSRSSSSRSITEQLRSSSVLPGMASPASPEGLSEEYCFAPSSTFAAFAGRSPSLFPRSPEMERKASQDDALFKSPPTSKAAKMLGISADLLPPPVPSPRPSSGTPTSSLGLVDDDEDEIIGTLGPQPRQPHRDPALSLSSNSSSSAPRSRPLRPPPLQLSTSVPSSSSSPSLRSNTSKAAKMLGLSEAEVGAAIPAPVPFEAAESKPPRSPRVLQKRSPEVSKGDWGTVSKDNEGTADKGRLVEEVMQKWPAKREQIRAWEVCLADLYKLSTSTTTILRASKLVYRPRLVSLSRTSSPSPSFALSSYKTRALTERETSRLTLTASTVVCAPADGETPTRSHGGRGFAIKVTGMVDALVPDGSGRTERKSSGWVIGMDDLEVYTEWMSMLKGAVKEMKGEASGTKAEQHVQQLQHELDPALLSPISPTSFTASLGSSSSSSHAPSSGHNHHDGHFDLDATRRTVSASVRSRASSNASDWAERKLELGSSGWRVAGGSGPLRRSTASLASRPSIAGSMHSARRDTMAEDDYSLYSLEAASVYSGSFSGAPPSDLPAPAEATSSGNSRPGGRLPLSSSFLDADSSDEESGSEPLAVSLAAPHDSLISPRTKTSGLASASSSPSRSAPLSLPPRAPPPSSALPLPPHSGSSGSSLSASTSAKRLSLQSSARSIHSFNSHTSSIHSPSTQPRRSILAENIPPPSLPPPSGALPLPPPPQCASTANEGKVPLRRPSRPNLAPMMPPPSGGLPPLPPAPPSTKA